MSKIMLMMQRSLLRHFYLLIFPILLLNCERPTESITQYVDPFIGSDETDFVSLWRSEAGLYPGAVAPHGMLQLTPETKAAKKYLQGYFYKEDTIRRFSMTEHFSGWPSGSSGKGVFMPFVTEDYGNISATQLKSSFSHDRERAEAGYYTVDLLDHEISCSFSSLVRSAMGRFIFPTGSKVGVAYSGFQQFEPLGPNLFRATLKAGRSEFQKTNLTIHLIFAFKEDVELIELGKQRRRKWLVVPTASASDELHFKIGISYTSEANAKLNLDTEIPDWDLEAVKQKARALWEKELSRVELEGNETDKTTFYTALYHASLLPVNVTDINRQYPGFEKNDPLGAAETHYHYFTPWDAFRTLHPLINFINPRKATDYINSSLRYYRTYGKLPEPSVMTSVQMSALYADALAQGIKFDTELAFQGLSELMLEKPYFRKEMPFYDSLGFVPFPMSYATTATLEFAFNDWALAQIAAQLGKNELADKLYQRSLNYRSQFDPKRRFMHSRNADRSWAPVSIYAEADKWNMSWFVPHNSQDLINLMGGNEAFCELLNQNFAEGHYVLDNECPMNFPFLFSHAGRPDLTMKWTNHTLRKYFKNEPFGIPGNDDWGTMSSWFMWGAMGIFPATPASGELILTGPLFDKITIHRSEKEQLVIQADGVSKENIYVQEALLNGNEIQSVFVPIQDLINGTLSFKMGSNPNMEFGQEGPLPYSLRTKKPAFELLSFSTSKTEVNPNQAFEINAKVVNRGALGSYHLQLKDDTSIIHAEYILIEEGQTKDINLSIKLFSSGKHNLYLDDKELELVVQASEAQTSPIAFKALQVEPLVHTTEAVTWSCRFQNISAKEVQFEPILYLDGAKQKTFPKIILAPGEEKELSSTFSLTTTGFHNIQLNDSQPARFKVYENAAEALVAHYTFDNPAETLQDQSGFNNHGVIHGQVQWVDGLSSGGMQLNGGYISIPKSASTEIAENEMSILCWYKPIPQKGKSSLITKGTFHMLKLEGIWQIKFAAGSWGRGQCYYNAKPKPDNLKEPTWLNRWTHFAGVKDSTSIRVFCNGQEKNRLDHVGELHDTDFEWRIGSNQVAEKHQAKGVFDEVMIFKGSLSEKDILEIVESVR